MNVSKLMQVFRVILSAYHTAEAVHMPFTPQSANTTLNNRFPASFALPTKLPCMASYTPCIPILLDEGRLRVERISALRTEEMAYVP